MYPVIPEAAVDMGLQEDLESHREALVSQKKKCSGALVSLCSLKGREILLPRRKLSGCGVHAFNFGLLMKLLASQSCIVTLVSALWALEAGLLLPCIHFLLSYPNHPLLCVSWRAEAHSSATKDLWSLCV